MKSIDGYILEILEKLKRIECKDNSYYNDNELKKDINELQQMLKKEDKNSINKIAKIILPEIEGDYNIYCKILYKLYYNWYELFNALIKNTSNDFFEANLEKIQYIDVNELSSLLHVMNYGMDKILIGNDDYIRKNSKDEWDYVLKLNENTSYIYLEIELELKNKLLNQFSLKTWISWLNQLPLDEMKVLCINNILLIDNMDNMIDNLLCIQVDKKIIYMFLQQYLELYEIEYNKLEEKQDKKVLEEHFENLINKFIQNNINYIQDILIYILKYVSVKYKLNKAPKSIRKVLVKVIKEQDLNFLDTIEFILDNNINSSSLVSSIMLLNDNNIKDEKSEIIEKLIESYLILLDRDYISLKQFDTNLDDSLCVWLISGIIASCNNPLEKIKSMLDSVYMESEGWNFNLEKYYRSISKVSNICILASMASEWMKIYEIDSHKVKEIYEFVWCFSHEYMRNNIRDNYNIEEMVKHIWGRLPMVYDYQKIEIQDKVFETIKQMDNIKYILIGMTMVKINIREESFYFKKEICDFVNKKYETDSKVILNYYNKESDLEWYKNIMAKLNL